MGFQRRRILRWALAGMVISGFVVLGYFYYNLHSAHEVLTELNSKNENKIELLQEKYKEKKAAEANLIRQTRMLQSQLGNSQIELEKIREELAQVKAEAATRIAEANKALDAKLASMTEKYETLDAAHQKMRKEGSELLQKHTELVAEHEQVTQAKLTAERLLQRTTSNLDRCADHNVKLSTIANELITNYSETGVVGDLMQVEPFTQLTKIEMEHMVQEYLDRIEKNEFKMREP